MRPGWLPAGAVTPRSTEVYLTLCRLHGHKAVSARRLGEACGLERNTIHNHLLRLRAQGLVAWDPDRRATLRPLYFPREDT